MNKKPRIRRWLAVGIILLFVGIAYAPAMAQNTENSQSSRGNWLYVGGIGPGNYTRIQDAIDNASDGDTIFVFEGIYNESIKIEKTLTLTGEDKNFTRINAPIAPSNYQVILIDAEEVTISGFTLQHEEQGFGCGIYIYSSYLVSIHDTIIVGQSLGIRCSQSTKNLILGNTISDCIFGIIVVSCDHSRISTNTITRNDVGISIEYSVDCMVTNNSILNNSFDGIDITHSRSCSVENNTILYNNNSGLDMSYCDSCYVNNNSVMYNMDGISFFCDSFSTILSNRISSNTQQNMQLINVFFCTIQQNIFENSMEGILLLSCDTIVLQDNGIYNHSSIGFVSFHSFSTITRNNFMNNTPHTDLWESQISWNENYWGRPLKHPKFLLVWRGLLNGRFFIPTISFDWHPAKEPYDIPWMS